MPIPAGGPSTVEAVKTHLTIADDLDDAYIASIVAAVNTRVLSWPVAADAEAAADWDEPEVAHIVTGANMLAARLVRRRNSPDGVAAFGELGPVYVQRSDPDVAMLLKLGQYKKPKAR